MRVLCLQNDDENCYPDGETLEIGEVYTAIDEITGYGVDDTQCRCYILAEVPPCDLCTSNSCFPCSWFVPLSDDAAEIEEEIKKEEEVFA